MRIIAGIARSVPLITPEGFETRPTSDKVKETLFNMLQGYIEGTTFLDLFAGSHAEIIGFSRMFPVGKADRECLLQLQVICCFVL